MVFEPRFKKGDRVKLIPSIFEIYDRRTDEKDLSSYKTYIVDECASMYMRIKEENENEHVVRVKLFESAKERNEI